MTKAWICTAGIAALLLAGVALPPPALAGCVPGIGCSQDGPIPYPALYDATCGDLWYLRNSAYDDNGLCFRTARGRRAFDNRGCTFNRPEDVPLSRIERENIGRIKEVERQRGCR